MPKPPETLNLILDRLASRGARLSHQGRPGNALVDDLLASHRLPNNLSGIGYGQPLAAAQN